MTLDFWYSCLYLPSTRVPGGSFMGIVCGAGESTPGLCSHQAGILPTGPQPQPHCGLNSISPGTSDAGWCFVSLLILCLSSLIPCLSESGAHFWLPGFLLSYKSSLYILGTNSLADKSWGHLPLACSLPLNLFLVTAEARACFHVNKKLKAGEARYMGDPSPADCVSSESAMEQS